MARVFQNKKIDEAIIAASEREQRLLGHELHETICQNLCAISILLQTLRRRVHAGKNVAVAEIDELQLSMDDAIEKTRALSRQLSLKHLERDGLIHALEGLAKVANAVAPCHFDGDETITLSAQDACTLYRVAQEAVRNALQHAGAEQITLRLARRNGRLTLEVRDNGRGFRKDQPIPQNGGLGMMRRRIESAGGKLSVETEQGSGTMIRCTLPIRTYPDAHHGSSGGLCLSPGHSQSYP